MKAALKFLTLVLLITGSVWGVNPVAKSEAFAPMSLAAALHDAAALLDRHPAAAVMRIEGDSMLPFFGDGAVVVVRPVASERLRPGMIVVYRNADGERVAHRVMGLNKEGWVVRGYNNDREDSTRVTAENLEGVIYATFYTNPRAGDPVLMAAVSAGVPVALAAPAK
jgi:signal peptidase I